MQEFEFQGARRYRLRKTILARILLLLLPAVPVHAVPVDREQSDDLTSKSIEDLMNMEVSSVSKKQEKLSRAAAAVFVITPEDIRSSGATNIPDLLRMVPGLDVAQINANTWAITARGFNLQFANKLLVLLDGRAVYTPLFGGVYWDTQDVPMEDIDRIEVIRGPGASVWGDNAVNGVINIITKSSATTQGALVTGGGGTEDGFGTFEYGGKVRRDTSYRVFAKYLEHGSFPGLPGSGPDVDDNWHLLHGGFRADRTFRSGNSVTVQGDLYAGSEGAGIVHSILEPAENITEQKLAELSGGNLIGRWKHTFSNRSDTTLQAYFDRYTRSGPESREVRNTFDLDFQHHFVWGARQDVVWGLGYRHTADQTIGTIDQAWIPAAAAGSLFNSFVQDEIALKPERVFLTAGSKLENSYFTGFDLEPSARVSWALADDHTLWVAVSQADRTPSRRDESLVAVLAALPGPAEILLRGNPRAKSEHEVAYELGYRARPTNRLSIDAAFFISSYDGLQSEEPSAPLFQQTPPLEIYPLTFGNNISGTTDGLELAVNWKVTSRWNLSPGYSLLQMHLHAASASGDSTSAKTVEGTSPRHQAQLRSHLNLSHGFAWDASAYFVDRLPAPAIASYTRIDAQLTWKLAESMDMSFVGQNLLKDRHLEFNDELQSVISTQVKRSAYIKFTWQF